MTEPEQPPTVDRILVELTIAAPSDDVWSAIRNPQKIYHWFGWDAPTLTDEIDFIFAKHVRADEASRILYFEGVPDRFEVESRGDGSSILRVVRAAPAGESWDGVYEDMVEGWISFVVQLRLAIEQHDLAPRRTLYFDGRAKAGGSGPIAALGLAGLRDVPDGAAFVAGLPTGEVVEGTACHRTAWQVGLTVPTWGDGVIIVTDMSVIEVAPHGRGMAILTTYGMSDEAFAELETRWRSWWDAHYDAPPASGDPCS